MEKKDFKMYESPVMETVDLELNSQILAGSDPEGAELPDYHEER